MKYGIIFWGNSTDNTGVFGLQKNTVRITNGTKSRIPRRPPFKVFEILNIHGILDLVPFVILTVLYIYIYSF